MNSLNQQNSSFLIKFEKSDAITKLNFTNYLSFVLSQLDSALVVELMQMLEVKLMETSTSEEEVD